MQVIPRAPYLAAAARCAGPAPRPRAAGPRPQAGRTPPASRRPRQPGPTAAAPLAAGAAAGVAAVAPLAAGAAAGVAAVAPLAAEAAAGVRSGDAPSRRRRAGAGGGWQGLALHRRRQGSSARQPLSRAAAAALQGAAPPATLFTDVAGVDEALRELQEIVAFLRQPQRFEQMGATLPRGCLLCGPPGTGKTLLARAVAGEAGVPFFARSAAEFVEIFAGNGAKRVRELFAAARACAPAIIFIDEIDALGRSRGPDQARNSEGDQTLNQLLTEMDGFARSRAGGGHRRHQPRWGARRRVAAPRPLRPAGAGGPAGHRGPRAHPAGPRAQQAPGRRCLPGGPGAAHPRMAGANLANLLNEAAIAAAGAGTPCIEARHVELALAKALLGPARLAAPSAAQRRLVAVHEAGTRCWPPCCPMPAPWPWSASGHVARPTVSPRLWAARTPAPRPTDASLPC